MPVMTISTKLSNNGYSIVGKADLEHALLAVASDLTALGRQFALVGGLAVSARAEVRFTRDVDLAVAVVDDADAEQLVHLLTNRASLKTR